MANDIRSRTSHVSYFWISLNSRGGLCDVIINELNEGFLLFDMLSQELK